MGKKNKKRKEKKSYSLAFLSHIIFNLIMQRKKMKKTKNKNNVAMENAWIILCTTYLFPRTLCNWIIVSSSSNENLPRLMSGLK